MAPDALLEQLVEGDRLAVGLERPGVDPAERQEVGDEAVEALGLVDDEVEELVARSRRRSRRCRRAGRTRRPGSSRAACAGRATPPAAAPSGARRPAEGHRLGRQPRVLGAGVDDLDGAALGRRPPVGLPGDEGAR